jgi:hypothetical protein
LGPLWLLFALFVIVPLGAPVEPQAARVMLQQMTIQTARARDPFMAVVVRSAR